MADTKYTVNYDDKRFTDVNADKKQALTELEKTYGGMINNADDYYQAQIDASKEWANTQAANQQAQTDFAIAEIEQQKAQTKKDYTKEQSGAYVDWQKQSNAYGANAEAMAAQGMHGTGYSESSLVSMYNTYQNRVTAARESYMLAVQNYNNSITEARLQNNALLAEIAYKALQEQLELSLQGFQYKNQLILAKADEKRKINDTYYSRYQDVLKQINTENALAEEVRQYNETKALQREQLQLQKDQFAWQKAQAAKTASGGGGGGGGGTIKKTSKKSSNSNKKNIQGVVKGVSSKKSEAIKEDGATGKTSNKVTVDMDSVLALGYGPISASRLNQLIDQGLVQEYQSGNKLKYRLTAKYLKQKNLIQ